MNEQQEDEMNEEWQPEPLCSECGQALCPACGCCCKSGMRVGELPGDWLGK